MNGGAADYQAVPSHTRSCGIEISLDSWTGSPGTVGRFSCGVGTTGAAAAAAGDCHPSGGGATPETSTTGSAGTASAGGAATFAASAAGCGSGDGTSGGDATPAASATGAATSAAGAAASATGAAGAATAGTGGAPPPEPAHSALAQPPTRPAHPQPPAPALPGSAPPAPKHLPPHLQPEPAAPMRPAQEKQSAPRRRPQATREQSAERQRTVEPCRGTAHLGLGAGSAVAVGLRTRAGQITPALAMVVIVRFALRDMDSRFPRDDVSRRRYRVAIVTQANDSGRYRTVAKERQSGDHPSMGHIRSVAPNQIWLATYRGNLETHTALELSVGTVNGCKIASVACERVAGFEPASTALQAGA